MTNSPEDIARRCIMDFVRRGGITEQNAGEVGSRVVESLKLFGVVTKQKDERAG